MKIIILILTLAFTAPTFAETDTWVKVTDDFEISKIIEANPIWSDTVSMVLGGSGGGGTTGGMMPMSFEKLSKHGIAVQKIYSNNQYESLVNMGKLPKDINYNEIYMKAGQTETPGILIDDTWVTVE